MSDRVKKPCRECPFRRTSAPGFLGAASGNPVGFIYAHEYGATHLPCHMTVDWENGDCQENAENAPTCAGWAIFNKNRIKLPNNPEDARDVKSREPDKEEVFETMKEFIDHHENPQLAQGFSGKLKGDKL